MNLDNVISDILNIEGRGFNEETHEEAKKLLKTKLTKKEYKLLFKSDNPLNDEALLSKLNLDIKRAAEVLKSAKAKIRHPKIRNTLVSLLV
jgi:hypothetical protein